MMIRTCPSFCPMSHLSIGIPESQEMRAFSDYQPQ